MIGEGVCPEGSGQRGEQICPAPSTPCPCPCPTPHPRLVPLPCILGGGVLSQERCHGGELGLCRGRAPDGLRTSWKERERAGPEWEGLCARVRRLSHLACAAAETLGFIARFHLRRGGLLVPAEDQEKLPFKADVGLRSLQIYIPSLRRPVMHRNVRYNCRVIFLNRWVTAGSSATPFSPGLRAWSPGASSGTAFVGVGCQVGRRRRWHCFPWAVATDTFRHHKQG